MKYIWIACIMGIVLQGEIFMLIKMNSLNLNLWITQVQLNDSLVAHCVS